MITTTTKRTMEIYGRTYEAGTTVELDAIIRDGYAGLSSVSAKFDGIDWPLVILAADVTANVWETDLPRKHLGE